MVAGSGLRLVDLHMQVIGLTPLVRLQQQTPGVDIHGQLALTPWAGVAAALAGAPASIELYTGYPL